MLWPDVFSRRSALAGNAVLHRHLPRGGHLPVLRVWDKGGRAAAGQVFRGGNGPCQILTENFFICVTQFSRKICVFVWVGSNAISPTPETDDQASFWKVVHPLGGYVQAGGVSIGGGGRILGWAVL